MYTCLVIEDEKIIRKWIRYGFDYSKHNCTVIGEAKDGIEGIEKIISLQPDIVITDITMPQKNAFEMLEATSNQLYATIIISGYADFSNAQQAIKYGAIEFIVKPIDEELFSLALEKAINSFEAQKLMREAQKQADHITDDFVSETTIKTKDFAVREMIHFVEEHFAEKFIFEDVVDFVGYSSSTLYTRFKKETHMTFNDYLNHYRVQKAIEIIKTKNFRLYEIPTQVGYADYKYFSQIFKKYTGFSPNQFIDTQF